MGDSCELPVEGHYDGSSVTHLSMQPLCQDDWLDGFRSWMFRKKTGASTLLGWKVC